MKLPKGGNQNLYIQEEQTTQWSKEKGQKDKQRSTKHTYRTKDRVNLNPTKNSGRVSNFCSSSDTRCVNLVTNTENILTLYYKRWLILYIYMLFFNFLFKHI